jgi:hypothetical protein
MLLPHIFTVFLAILVIWWASKNLVCKFASHNRAGVVITLFLRTMTIAQLLTMFSYSYNQIIFILEYSMVGTNLSTGSIYNWLAYEYLNLLTHLLFTLSVSVYMVHYNHLTKYRRRSTDTWLPVTKEQLKQCQSE